ncbi:MAG: PEP-CTERM sorting domain-containing protein [Aquabacterium sp.]
MFNFQRSAAGLALSLATLFSASAQAETIVSDLQGWVRVDGRGNGAAQFNNTYTGYESGYSYNTWANFDLAGLSGQVTSAQLELHTGVWLGNEGRSHELSAHDVSTSLQDLMTQNLTAENFTDLQSGHAYASAVFAENETRVLDLSAEALADLTAALGGTFRIGFTNLSYPNGPESVGIYINGDGWKSGSSYYVAPRLTLQISSVPEPSVTMMGGLGLLALAIGLRRRQA